MRALFVNHFALPPDLGGGTRHVELGRALVRSGVEVCIAASDFHYQQREYFRRADASDRRTISETIDGIDFRWLWTRPYRENDGRRILNWTSFWTGLVRGRDELPRPDVVVGSTPHLLAALGGLQAARRLGVPFVLEVRDLWPETLRAVGMRAGPGYWGMLGLARWLYEEADRIVVLAAGVGEHLQRRYGVPARRIRFIPNGVDVGSFGARDLVDPARNRFVYAGAHGTANGLDTVLRAADRMRDVPDLAIDLIGDGPEKGRLQRLAEELGLASVTFHPPIPKTEIPGRLAEAGFGLMVLRDAELFAYGVSPNKLFDYMAARLPVVCNVPGEVAGIAADAGSGVQAPDASVAGLEAAMRRAIALPVEARTAMGARGRAWVAEERDRARLAERYAETLGEVVRAR